MEYVLILSTQAPSNEQLELNNTLFMASTIQRHAPSLKTKRENKNYISASTQDKEKIDKLLNILNWISQCFVLYPQGDVVATELERNVAKGEVLILLSQNDLDVDDTKNLATMNFRTLTTNIIDDMVKCRIKSNRKRFNMLQWRDTILSHLVEVAWPRMRQRFQMITEIKSKLFDIETIFNRMIDHWHTAIPAGEGREYPEWIKNAAMSVYGDSNEVVEVTKKWFRDLINMGEEFNRTNVKQDVRLETFEKALCRISFILDSPFMIDMKDQMHRLQYGFKNDQDYFIDKVYRRLWKLFRYFTGSEAYVDIALPFFEDLAGVKNSSKTLKVNFKWIFVNMLDLDTKRSISFEEKETSQQLEIWLEQKLDNVLNEPTIKLDIDAKRLENTKEVCNMKIQNEKVKDKDSNIIFRNKIHCEVNLIIYSIVNRINVEGKAIGVSKLMCWSCTHFVAFFEESTGEYWNISGTSGKFHHQWCQPVAGLFKPQRNSPLLKQPVEDAVADVMVKAGEEFKEILKRNIQKVRMFTAGHKRSFSDSSVGVAFTIYLNTSHGPMNPKLTSSSWPAIVQSVNKRTVRAPRT